MSPVAESSVRPSGSEGVTNQVYGVTPPTPLSVVRYACPSTAGGSEVVAIDKEAGAPEGFSLFCESLGMSPPQQATRPTRLHEDSTLVMTFFLRSVRSCKTFMAFPPLV